MNSFSPEHNCYIFSLTSRRPSPRLLTLISFLSSLSVISVYMIKMLFHCKLSLIRMISYTVQVYIMTIITILRQQHAKIMKETHYELRTLGTNTKLRSVCTREEFSLFVLDLVFNDENKDRKNDITLISFWLIFWITQVILRENFRSYRRNLQSTYLVKFKVCISSIDMKPSALGLE